MMARSARTGPSGVTAVRRSGSRRVSVLTQRRSARRAPVEKQRDGVALAGREVEGAQRVEDREQVVRAEGHFDARPVLEERAAPLLVGRNDEARAPLTLSE